MRTITDEVLKFLCEKSRKWVLSETVLFIGTAQRSNNAGTTETVKVEYNIVSCASKGTDEVADSAVLSVRFIQNIDSANVRIVFQQGFISFFYQYIDLSRRKQSMRFAYRSRGKDNVT